MINRFSNVLPHRLIHSATKNTLCTFTRIKWYINIIMKKEVRTGGRNSSFSNDIEKKNIMTQ
jgi:hypothetical protein